MPTSLRKFYWFVSGFAIKYKKIVVGSLVGGVAVISFVLLIWPQLPKPRQRHYVGIVGKYGLSQVPARVEADLGMGLTTLGDDLQPQPGLAKKWEVTDEGRVYRFYLRDDIFWSDGKKVTINDFNFSIPDVAIEKIEPDILEFRLPEPFSPFPLVLSNPVLRDGKYSTGKYDVSDIRTDGPFLRLVQLENEDEVLIFRFYDTASLATTAFKLGEVDELVGLFDASSIGEWRNLKIETDTQHNYYVAVFYNNNDPLLADKRVRQALSYAIEDKTEGYSRATGPINTRSWAYNAVVKKYDYDEARARELLEQAIPPESEQKLVVELSSTPDLLPVAEDIKKDWERVGGQVDIKVVASTPSTYQALVAAQEIPLDPDQYQTWHSTQATNFTNFRSPKIDKLLEDGRQTLKLNDRRQIYYDFQRFLAEESPATFLYHPDAVVIKRGNK